MRRPQLQYYALQKDTAKTPLNPARTRQLLQDVSELNPTTRMLTYQVSPDTDEHNRHFLVHDNIAFYESSGISSGQKGTFFPCLMLRENTSRLSVHDSRSPFIDPAMIQYALSCTTTKGYIVKYQGSFHRLGAEGVSCLSLHGKVPYFSKETLDRLGSIRTAVISHRLSLRRRDGELQRTGMWAQQNGMAAKAFFTEAMEHTKSMKDKQQQRYWRAALKDFNKPIFEYGIKEKPAVTDKPEIINEFLLLSGVRLPEVTQRRFRFCC